MQTRERPKRWKEKVHPAFLEIAKLYRDSQKILSQSGPADLKRDAEKLRAQVCQTREELLKRYPDLRPGSPSNHIQIASARFLSERDALLGTLEWLCWRRTGQPLEALITEEKAGSLDAHKKIMRVRDDFWRTVYRQGPVAPFKGNHDHSEIIELGFNLGLNKLTDEELADCFDEFCTCGKDHDADALKKQRARVRKQLQGAHDQRLKAIPSRQRFGACGADGVTAKAYHWESKGIRYVTISRRGEQTECLVYPNGDVVAVEGSQFYGPEGLDHLLQAFGVDNPEQIFSMFFPENLCT